MKKSVAKRIKFTGSGKIIRRRMAQGHFKAKESGKKTRIKRKNVIVAKSNTKSILKYAAR